MLVEVNFENFETGWGTAPFNESNIASGPLGRRPRTPCMESSPSGVAMGAVPVRDGRTRRNFEKLFEPTLWINAFNFEHF